VNDDECVANRVFDKTACLERCAKDLGIMSKANQEKKEC